LYAERNRVQAEKERFAWESGWDQTRQIWAVLINQWRKEGSPAIKPSELIKLSWDKPEDAKIELTPELVKEIGEQMKKRFGSTLKNRPVKKKKKRGK
jgi:hypothetical protein